MSRGVQLSLFGSLAAAVLIAVAGCSHDFYGGEREAWRHDAEVACVNSGAVKDGPERVRISAISGPGICGADFPIQISALGESGPLGYDDEPLRPPGAVPDSAVPRHWPLVQSNALPPPQAPPLRGRPLPAGPVKPAPLQSASPQPGRPMSLYAPGVPEPGEDDAAFEPTPPQPYDGGPGARLPGPLPQAGPPPPIYTPRAQAGPPGSEEHVPLGWPRDPTVTASVGPVEVKPTAILACPIVSALDQWITAAVQPAALHWFRQPVVEIKQISAYSCRGMNGNPNAHISEHAFGNALDIAEFDARRWPQDQRAIRLARHAGGTGLSARRAARRMPGIHHRAGARREHLSLQSHSRRFDAPIERSPHLRAVAMPGEVVAERARARYAAQHFGDPGITGSIKKTIKRPLGYSGEDDDRLPIAAPGED